MPILHRAFGLRTRSNWAAWGGRDLQLIRPRHTATSRSPPFERRVVQFPSRVQDGGANAMIPGRAGAVSGLSTTSTHEYNTSARMRARVRASYHFQGYWGECGRRNEASECDGNHRDPRNRGVHGSNERQAKVIRVCESQPEPWRA